MSKEPRKEGAGDLRKKAEEPLQATGPPPAPREERTDSRKRPPGFPWYILLVFVLFAAGIVVVGYHYFRQQRASSLADCQASLAAIADLKVRQILDWRKERLSDAAAILENHVLLPRLQQFLAAPASADLARDITGCMATWRKYDGYCSVHLLGAEGNLLLSSSDTPPQVDELTRDLALDAARSGKVAFSDLHRHGSGPIRLGIYAPVPAPEAAVCRTAGILLLEVDPYGFLFPVIQRWPTPSPSAETLLVRREGNEVVYVNELRHRTNTALVLRRPVSDPNLPAAMLVRGQEGVLEGTDYRDIPVLAAGRKVPGTPWFMVAKVDQEEIYAPLREKAWTIGLITSLLLLVVTLVVGAQWHKQKLEFTRRELAERKQAEAALQIERQRLHSVLEGMPVMVCLLTPDYHVAFANRAFREKFGESHGRHCYEYCFGKTEPCDFCESYQVLKTGEPHHWVVTSPDGAAIIDSFDFPFNDVDGSPLILEVDIDITERKQAEQRLAAYQRRLRSLGAKLALAEEQERRRIAAGLHDDVGQALSVAMMKLRSLRQKSPPAAGAPLEKVEELLGHAVHRTRSLLFDLSPPPLYELGLEAGIEYLAEKIQAEHKLPVTFHREGSAAPLSEEVRGILFRAVRELLHNTVKHAGARNIRITLRQEAPNLRIEVADDGKGFDPEKARLLREMSGGFGLFHIRERLDYIGGGLEIHSTSGSGTRITLLAPLANATVNDCDSRGGSPHPPRKNTV